MSEYYLSHHGIEGQKWGVRRFQNEDGSLTPEGRKRYGVDNPDGDYTSSTYKKLKAKHLSNKELKTGIQRLQDEKTYKQLVKETNQTGWTKTGNFLAKVATESTERALTKVLSGFEYKLLADFLREYGIDIDKVGGDKKETKTKKPKKESEDTDTSRRRSTRSDDDIIDVEFEEVTSDGSSSRAGARPFLGARR